MKQYAVIGLGKFGTSIAETLCRLGEDVLGVDVDMERVSLASERITHAVQANATDESVIRSLGLRNFDVVIVTIGEIQPSIMVTLLCKECGVGRLIAKANDELHAKILLKIGADTVVNPERDMGMRLARNLISPNILEDIELSPDYRLMEIKPGKGWAGKSLKQLNLRALYGINVMSIKTGDQVNINPSANDVVGDNDLLLIVGESAGIQKIEYD